MANGFLELIEIRPNPLRRALGSVLLATGALVAILWSAPTVGVACAALAMLVAVLACERCALLRRHPARAVLLPDGRWNLCFGAGAPLSARLMRAWGEELGPVIALQWTLGDGRRVSAWLLPADCGAVVWRRLRVRLRLS